MLEYLTRDNITLALSIFGSLGASASWAVIYLSQRKKFRLSIAEFMPNNKGCLFYMMFENQSRLPISITRIMIMEHGQTVDCVVIPKIVREFTCTAGTEVIERKIDYSLPFPVSLSPLAATSGYVSFECDQPLLKKGTTTVTFEIYTNRGKASRIELELSQDARHPKSHV